MNPNIFREYDIRGIAANDLLDYDVELIGKAYGTIIHKNGGKEIILGRDIRESSPRIAEALKKGILSTGINVINVGEISTPMLYYAVNKMDVDGGICVTASHNPPEYNGFKVMVGKTAIYGEKIKEIFEIANKGNFDVGKGEESEKNIEEQYLEDVASLVKIKKKLKIVIDSGNAMASELAPKLMEKIGVKAECIYCEKNPLFPNHLPDPVVEKNVRDLATKVIEEKADFGIAFDGDVDRLGVVDEKGKLIYGDKLLGLLAKPLLKDKKGAKVIYEVKCSQSLPEYVEQLGGKPIIWKTGHSLIKAKIREENALLAGEMSGHMYFGENWFGVDDALIAAAKVCEIVSRTDKRLSELIEEMPFYFSSPEFRVETTDEEKFDFVDNAKKHFMENFEVVDVDGARVLFEKGWALIRASNTQPKLILRFEGKTEKDLQEIEEKFLSELEKISGRKISLALE